MRFPLRLTADLTLGAVARTLHFPGHHPLIVNVAAGGSVNVNALKSPIVWIGDPEPLELEETPRVVNALAAAGRHVFLPTSGILLRHRIHEFQPSARLHLTIRFDDAEAAHDQRLGQSGAFRDALESVRTARLSGFLLCAQLILHSSSEAGEFEQLHGELSKLGFDGFLFSVATAASPGGEAQRSILGLRQRLLGRRWAWLSALVDSVVSSRATAVVRVSSAAARSGREHRSHLPARNCEESVQAP
jgi:hypothetical protein